VGANTPASGAATPGWSRPDAANQKVELDTSVGAGFRFGVGFALGAGLVGFGLSFIIWIAAFGLIMSMMRTF
jgi:hypothetical protein